MARIVPAHRRSEAPVERPGVGTKVQTGEAIPVAASWKVEAHGDPRCSGSGARRGLGGRAAPPCPVCNRPVGWVLDHQAPSAAPIEGDDALG